MRGRTKLFAVGIATAFCAVLVALVALVAASGAVGAHASGALGRVVSADPANVTPNINNGAVYKTAEYNGVLYAGGSFTSVSAAAGVRPAGTFARSRIVAFRAASGSITSFAPRFNGLVWAITANAGYLYVGGTFSTVNGVARRGLVKLNPATGAVDKRFDAKLTGAVTDAAIVNGRLLVSGAFTKKIQAVSPFTGADAGYLNIAVRGSVARNAGPTQVYRFAVNRAGTRLVGVGNFTTVGGQTRYRAFMLTLGRSGTVNAWQYVRLRTMCADRSTPDYLRDVDFAPDGSNFVLVSAGFVSLPGQTGLTVCDAAARFETGVAAPRRPTWINYTGGDTLHSVAVTDKAVYVQGHQRWLDNPRGRDSAGPGAVSRPGIGALDPRTGRALAWNPGKDRGVGGRDLLVTARGLWVSSDSDHIGGETRKRVALMPR
jgi:Domain of unknown function (DUF5122) beta-propeller